MIVIVMVKVLVIPKHFFVIVMKLGLNLTIVQVRKKVLINAKYNTYLVAKNITQLPLHGKVD